MKTNHDSIIMMVAQNSARASREIRASLQSRISTHTAAASIHHAARHGRSASRVTLFEPI
jgi:hypothetical protein